MPAITRALSSIMAPVEWERELGLQITLIVHRPKKNEKQLHETCR